MTLLCFAWSLGRERSSQPALPIFHTEGWAKLYNDCIVQCRKIELLPRPINKSIQRASQVGVHLCSLYEVVSSVSLSLSRSLWLSLPLLLAVGQSAQGPRTRARTGLTVCCDTSSLDRGPHLVCYYPKRCTLPMYPPGLVLHWLEKCRHCSLSPQPISLFAHLSLSLSRA